MGPGETARRKRWIRETRNGCNASERKAREINPSDRVIRAFIPGGLPSQPASYLKNLRLYQRRQRSDQGTKPSPTRPSRFPARGCIRQEVAPSLNSEVCVGEPHSRRDVEAGDV
jgi:hypothetical protein